MKPLTGSPVLAPLLALLLGAAACSRPSEKTEAPSAPAGVTVPAQIANMDVYRFKIGALDAIALNDGGMDVPNDNKVFGIKQTPEAVGEVLTASGLPTDKIALHIHPMLVTDGARLVLIDTGTGGAMGPATGKLMDSLKTAGVDASAITDILISHSHGDHVGGLVTDDGALAFPNATIRMAAAEWTYLKADTDMADLVKAITSKVQTFEPGSLVTPSITAVAVPGHTPGHTAYEIVSGDARLLYIGDTVHHPVLSVQRPEWRNSFDADPVAGARQRRTELRRVAASEERVYAVHFPFPGLGHIRSQGDSFTWVPEAMSAAPMPVAAPATAAEPATTTPAPAPAPTPQADPAT